VVIELYYEFPIFKSPNSISHLFMVFRLNWLERDIFNIFLITVVFYRVFRYRGKTGKPDSDTASDIGNGNRW
jgi:hypothetical protein